MVIKFFYLIFHLVSLGGVLFLIFSSTLLRKVAAVVFLFLVISVSFLLLGLEFLALSVVIIYLGAVSVLFLFVVMLTNVAELGRISQKTILGVLNNLYVVLVIVYSLLILVMFINLLQTLNLGLGVVLDTDINYLQTVWQKDGVITIWGLTEFNYLGGMLWNLYVVWSVLAGVILLIAVFGSVAVVRGILYLAMARRRILQGGLVLKGSMTNKPKAYKARRWELASLKTFDQFDSFGQPITVSKRYGKVLSICPAEPTRQGFQWLTNKSRFFFDALKHSRVTAPAVVFSTCKKNIRWKNAVYVFKRLVKRVLVDACSVAINAVRGRSTIRRRVLKATAGPFSSMQDCHYLNTLINIVGGGDSWYKNYKIPQYSQPFYVLDKPWNFVKEGRKTIMLLAGVDLRFEVPSLHSMLRYYIDSNQLVVYAFGMREAGFSNPVVNFLGPSLKTFLEVMEGRHLLINTVLDHEKLNGSDSKVMLWVGPAFDTWLRTAGQAVGNLTARWVNRFNVNFGVLVASVGLLNAIQIGLGAVNGQPVWQEKLRPHIEVTHVVFGGATTPPAQRTITVLCTPVTTKFKGPGIVLGAPAFLERRNGFTTLWGEYKTTNQVLKSPLGPHGAARPEQRVFKEIITEVIKKSKRFATTQRDIDNYDKFKVISGETPWCDLKLPVYPVTGVKQCLQTTSSFYIANFWRTDPLAKRSERLKLEDRLQRKQRVNYYYAEFIDDFFGDVDDDDDYYGGNLY